MPTAHKDLNMTEQAPDHSTTKMGWVVYHDAEGRLHRDDGPALVKPDGAGEEWYRHGLLHRDGGPAATYREMRCWYQAGKLHRVDGPALEGTAGQQAGRVEWYLHGRLHRAAGPAVVINGVREEWHVAGLLHRINAPAIIHADGRTEHYVAGDKA